MRCLVVADLHYSLPQFDWLLAAAPEFDLVIFAGDALDVGSFVDFRAQIVVVKKYLSLLSGITKVILCSGNHDLDERSAEGEKIARWIGEVRELGIACDGDDLDDRRHALYGLPVVGRAQRKAAPRGPVARRRRKTARAMDLGASCPAGELADQLGRQAVFRRRRSRAMDRALSAVDGDLGPRASIAVHSRTARGSTGSATVGYSIPACSPAGRRSTSCSISTMRRRSGWRRTTRAIST